MRVKADEKHKTFGSCPVFDIVHDRLRWEKHHI